MTNIDIAALRLLHSEATGAAWEVEGATVYVADAYEWSAGPQCIASCTGYVNARLIVAMRNALPALLRVVQEAREVWRVVGELEPWDTVNRSLGKMGDALAAFEDGAP